jgi:alpha-glucosidase (family GH31 glycosyl hydrolase)
MRRLLRNSLLPRSAVICAALLSAAAPARSADFVRDGNQVICGAVRFDVLSPMLIRMQYAPGEFVEAPTAVVVNRSLSDRDFRVTANGDWLEIKTSRMSVQYRPGTAKLGADNLRVRWRDDRGAHEWAPGQADDGNLGGPISSFNAIIEATKPGNTLPDFPPGMLSRNGYCLLDDSRTPVWDEQAQWIAPRGDQDDQDWYFFVYGTHYGDFFRQYTALAGKIPMIPRYALGAWVTDLNFEYFRQNVTEEYLQSIISRFRQERIPLDIMVLDFGWHLYGWRGSLDWSPIIPDPRAFLARLHGEGIRVTLNDHPSSGLFCQDTHIPHAREKLHLAIADPSQWTDISKDWAFHTDAANQGQREQWFSPDYRDADWPRMAEATMWENAGYPQYDGIGWYRKWVESPKNLAQGPVHVAFGGVDDEYDLYINGKLAGHHGVPGKSVYDHLTDTDVTAYWIRGARNLICLRVNDWGGLGGISGGPVVISSGPVQTTSVPFNLADKLPAQVYMGFHDELVDQGVDFWWIDGESAQMDGLNGQMWTNRVYYESQEQHTGRRSFVFSRYGGPGSHRYPAFFTGDCYSNWKVLGYEIPYTLKAGNCLIPYVTHDIGGFIGRLDDEFELYARWIQFGALSPILRLHSAHENPVEGNARLPWNYGEQGVDLCREFFQLRYRLIPYLYTYCRIAYDTGMPLARPLYLGYPGLDAAYDHFDQYLLGSELLVAPITSPGVNGLAAREVYLPPGNWVDYFTGESYSGGRTISYQCPLDRMPLFVKQGSIIPMQPDMAFTTQKPVDPLIVDAYPGGSTVFTLYEDDGMSLEYRRGRCSWTPIKLKPDAAAAATRIVIGPAAGSFRGQSDHRSYVINLHCSRQPRAVAVAGRPLPANATAGDGWEWHPESRLAAIRLKARPIRTAVSVVVRQ